MTAVEVFALLRARGARLELRGALLHLEAPKGALDAGLKAALIAQKADLVELLTVDLEALIAGTFERIAKFWIGGADLPPPEFEAAIDAAVRAGDVTALNAALSLYEQAAQERCDERSATAGQCE
jgi:hypothetical protein